MKIIAFILSFLVLQLSVQPCCLDGGHNSQSKVEKVEQAHSCCGTESDSREEEPSSKTCSPFFSCCAGAVVILESTAYQAQLIPLVREIQIPRYSNFYDFEFGSSLLQPPKPIS